MPNINVGQTINSDSYSVQMANGRNNWYYGYISATLNSQSIENNTSNVTINYYFRASFSGAAWSGSNIYFYLDKSDNGAAYSTVSNTTKGSWNSPGSGT